MGETPQFCKAPSGQLIMYFLKQTQGLVPVRVTRLRASRRSIVLSAASQSSYPASSSNQTMLINGSNFQSGATVTFHDPQGNPYVRTPSFVSSRQLSHQFNDGSDAGTWTVFVTNPDGPGAARWAS